jgi:hypothetical protein
LLALGRDVPTVPSVPLVLIADEVPERVYCGSNGICARVGGHGGNERPEIAYSIPTRRTGLGRILLRQPLLSLSDESGELLVHAG